MGFVRFLLASAVVAAHTGGARFGFIDGRSAVLLFYIISGFYMSLVLNTKYKNHPLTLFYSNRFLRLWPTYLVVLTFALIGYGFSGRLEGIAEAVSKLPLLWKALAGLSEIFIVGQDWLLLLGVRPDSLIPYWAPYTSGVPSPLQAMVKINLPVFTIAIELTFYALAPFVVKSAWRIAAFLWAGLIYYQIIDMVGVVNDLAFNYHFFPGTIPYFALGCVSYMVYETQFKKVETNDSLSSMVVLALGVLGVLFFKGPLAGWVALLAVFAVPFLFQTTSRSRWDTNLGNMAYGVYLAHVPISLILADYGWDEYKRLYPYLTLVLAYVAAWLLFHFVENPIDRYRQTRIYKKQLTQATEA